MAAVVLPGTLANNALADATQFMALFNALANGIGSIGNADVRAAAGISTSKLAEQRSSCEQPIQVLPYSQDASIDATPVEWACDTTFRTVARYRVKARPGQLVDLVGVEVYVNSRTGANNPRINVLVDGIQLGGSSQDVTAAGYYSLPNSFNFDSPIFPLANDSVIEIQIGASGAGASIAGVTANIVTRRRFIP